MAGDFDVTMSGVEEFIGRLDATPAVLGAANAAAMETVVRTGEATAKGAAPRRSGRLFSSITGVVEGAGMDMVGRIGPNTNYAPFVEFGTGLFGPRAQRIDPGKVMAWPASATLGGRARKGSGMIFARSTAGMRPQPYMRPAADDVRAQGPGIFRKEAEDLVHELAHGI